MSDTAPTELPLLFSVENGIALVTLNRPAKMNALNPELIVRLARCWDAIQADRSVRVAILAAAGERTFCAGADLARLTPLLTRARQAEDEWDEALLAEPKLLNRAMLRRVDFTTPVIAAARGSVVAGGMELMLACDLRIVADTATLGLAEVKRGLIPAAGGIARVSRQLGWAAAAEILLVGDQISAAEALRVGLVNRVVAVDQVLPTAQALAEKMAQNSPLAMRKAKEAMTGASGRPLEEAFGVEDQCIKVVLRSEDAREGSRAFMEKRKPKFSGT
jgi:enoyl-CoA hydratase/carnithine racemase